MQLKSRVVIFFIGVIAHLISPSALDIAKADEASRTWTGNVQLYGNYYHERSTRVVAPNVRMQLDSPHGEFIQADYLVDAITSASISTGVVADRAFTEVRHQGTVGVGKEWSFGGTPVLLQAFGRYSYEPDYISRSVGLFSTVALNKRATLLQLSLAYNNDDVGKVIRGLNRGSPDLSATRRIDMGPLHGLLLNAVVSHAFSPIILGAVGYDMGFLDGFLSNPYRTVTVNGTPLPENHPSERLRHMVYGRIQYYVPETRTAIHFIPRFYFDSWNVYALNPEFLLVQQLTDTFWVQLKLRYYIQTQSFFYKPQVDYTLADEYRTADPKMTPFRNTLLGFHTTVELSFLEKTLLDFARNAIWDLSFEYIWNTNRYGDGVIVQSGLRVPF